MDLGPGRSDTSARNSDDVANNRGAAESLRLILRSIRARKPTARGYVDSISERHRILYFFCLLVASPALTWLMRDVYSAVQTGELFPRCEPYLVNDVPIGRRCTPRFGSYERQTYSIEPEYRVAFLDHQGLTWSVVHPEQLFNVPQRMADENPRLFYEYIPPEVGAGDPDNLEQRINDYFATKYPLRFREPLHWEQLNFGCMSPYRCELSPWWAAWQARQQGIVIRRSP